MEIQGDLGVLISGAASGLGRATADYFRQKGARLALLDKNLEALPKGDASIFSAKVDVTNEAEVQAAIHEASGALGPLRVCVNCAGIAPASRLLGRHGLHELSLFEQVLKVNLVGTFNVLRFFVEQLAEEPLCGEERGVIINTASVAAFEGQIGQAAYSASKGGVAAMTLPLARELTRLGVRVMTIAPGIMHTPMMAGMPQEVQDSLAASIPFPSRMGKPEEYAALVGQIVENSYLNGSVIRLDGAIRMAAK